MKIEYINTSDHAISLLSDHLESGSLNLMLGSGSSISIGMPSFIELMNRILNNKKDDHIQKSDYDTLFDLTRSLKNEIGENDFNKTVYHELYDGIYFEFEKITKELLLAISSLVIGNTRGRVTEIMNLNYDSVLEWFLSIYGLKVSSVTNPYDIKEYSDLEIYHPHGFLPKIKSLQSKTTDELVFFPEDEIKFKMSGDNYWRNKFIEFFQRSHFLSIGVSYDTFERYLKDYIVVVRQNAGAEKSNIYSGFAVFVDDIDEGKKSKLRNNGIVPLYIPKEDLPKFVFEISQKASKLEIEA